MPSGLRVTRIDRGPGGRELPLLVNGQAVGSLLHRTSLEITVASGELLLEVILPGQQPVFQMLTVMAGATASVLIGRRGNLGVLETSHYLQLERPFWGLPDRTIHPLNLARHSAREWLMQKRSLGEPLSRAQGLFLQTLELREGPVSAEGTPEVPSLVELGAFSALGLGPEATEADVREAFRLLVSIHTPDTGRQNVTILRLEEAFRIALSAVKRRAMLEVSELGR